ncbi:unnamed protein product [Echinostoma caproni]|uniref:Integrase catalytic domain-containing protein n=1 Tax=Echinostoma caproni TaxID=27848 RepID=A0A183A1U6_9TREM|nr:unnamed protein product [Echinostoma caproni]
MGMEPRKELAHRTFLGVSAEEVEKIVVDRVRTSIHGPEARVQLLRRPALTLDEALKVATSFEIVEQARISCNELSLGQRPGRTDQKNIFQAIIERDHSDEWDQYLGTALLAYRAQVHSSIKYSPALRFGSELRLPEEIQSPLAPAKMIDMNDSVLGLQQRLSTAFRTTHESVQSEQQHQKSAYDRGAHGLRYARGDLVLLYHPSSVPGTSQKFHQPWQGPHIVVHQRSPNA